MKIIAICDKKDISIGLRLVGIEGVMVNTPAEFDCALKNAIDDRQAAIVVIAKKYAARANEIRLNKTIPLIVEI